MADSFGLKIGVEGEKEFKSALKDINQSFKVLGSEMNLVKSQFDKNDKSVSALTSRNTVLNKEISTQKEKVETLESALKNAADSFGDNDKRTQAWAVQLNNAKADLNNMEHELGENNKALETSEKDFDQAGKEADDFGDELKESGKEADGAKGKFEKLGSIVKGVGAAMGAAFVAIGAASVAAGKALANMTVEAAAYADEILTMSSVTGMSTESLQAYKYAAELVDVSMETLTKSMSKNVKSMSSARGGTGAAADAYKALGVAVTDSNGELRDSETVYWEAIDALGEVQNETERDALAMQLFGKSAQELNPLIAQGSEGIAALTEEARNMGAVMSTESLEALGKFDDSMQRLKSGGVAAKNALGLILLPQLQILADDGVGLLGEFTRGINEAGGDVTKISEVVSKTVGGIVDTIMKVLPDIIQLALDIVMAIGGGIIDNLSVIVDAISKIAITILQGLIDALPSIVDGALQLVLALVQGIIENLPAILEAAMLMITTLVSGIAQALPTLIPAIVKAIMLMVQTLIDNLPMLLEAALQLIIGLAQGLLDALPVLIEALPKIIKAIVKFVIDAIPMIIEAGIALLISLVEALPDIIEAIVEAIPLILEGIITALIEGIPLIIEAGIKLLIALVENLPQIITAIVKAIPQIVTGLVTAIGNSLAPIASAGFGLFVSLIQKIPQALSQIVAAVPQIITGIINTFANGVYKFVNMGGNLIKGLWQGISDAGAWLWNKISGFFGGVVDNIKNFFGIHSPSTLFSGLGANMGEGIGVGFEKAMDKVSGEMQNAIPTTLDAPDIDMGVGINAALGGAGSAVSIADLGFKLDGIASLMTEMFPALLEAMNINIVLDDGTLVGRLAPEIDRNLALLRRRGAALGV
jgi:phage-related protein